ncbi:unnamed protein product [Mytilus edulis]|uniref:Uncharacterized protein n=1 Tax=Mytilus edulis TaxID=6550 RepID=A0A8S3TFH3_MYTED|nr:unnamed protein product [Mytilus edulis]
MFISVYQLQYLYSEICKPILFRTEVRNALNVNSIRIELPLLHGFLFTATVDDNASIVSTVLPSTVTVTVDDNASSATVDDNATVLSTVLPSTVTAAVDDNASIVTVSTCHIENIPTARPTIEIANVSTAEVEAVEAEIPTLISHTQSISETSVSRDSFAKFLQLPKAKETSAREKTYVPLPKALSGL